MLNRCTKHLLLLSFLYLSSSIIFAQTSYKSDFKEPKVYAGIEVGSKGVKMSIVEIGTDAQSNTTFRMLKDSAVNTDFISFTQPAFNATLKGLAAMYSEAMILYSIPFDKTFTVISSPNSCETRNVTYLTNMCSNISEIACRTRCIYYTRTSRYVKE